MKTKLLLPALALIATLHAAPPTAEIEHAIEHAYLIASETALAEAVKPLDPALAADPKNPALLYERAFAYYAATTPLRATNRKESIVATLEKSAALLERVKGEPWESEAAALRGSILGQLISLKGGMAGMTLGAKSTQLLARAAKTLPGSPRVLLFRGIALFNTPAAFGGDLAEGAKLLQQSADAFAKANNSSPGPRWGRADALTWLGLTRQKTGDLDGARAAWQQALAVEPDYVWVKFALLPSLDRPAKK